MFVDAKKRYVKVKRGDKFLGEPRHIVELISLNITSILDDSHSGSRVLCCLATAPLCTRVKGLHVSEDFQQMQIWKWKPLPQQHVLGWSLGDTFLVSSAPILSRPVHSAPLHAGMVPNSVSVFTCLHSRSHDALQLPTLGLPCRVLLCPQSVSLSLAVSLFPSPLSLPQHSSDLFLPRRSRSDGDRGERRERRRVRLECQTLSGATTLGLSLFFGGLLLLLRFSVVVASGKWWQSVGSTSEVGTFDRCVSDAWLQVGHFSVDSDSRHGDECCSDLDSDQGECTLCNNRTFMLWN